MSLLRLSLLLAIAVLLPTKVLSQTAPQATYYVDFANGSDANSGTSLGSAFQTLEKAREVVRTINTNMTGDIYVYLRGGTHWRTTTFNLTDADSGTNGFNVIYSAYHNEKAVISGGKKITGWALKEDCPGIYKAYAGDIETRQLFVNGTRAIRARSSVGLPASFVKATGYRKSGNLFVNSPKPMDQWENLSEVEFVYRAEWTAPRVRIDTIKYDGTTTTVFMQQPGWGGATNKGYSSVGSNNNANGLPWYIDNAFELLDTEGEWYLNRIKDSIYYKPKYNEDISKATIIAPILNELIRVQGTDLDHKAHNLQFIGIAFRHSTDLKANSDYGHVDSQNDLTYNIPGTTLISAAVNLKYANSIRLERDVFEQLGNTGINMYAGCQDNLVVGSRFTDISGKGVEVGEYFDNGNVNSENYANTSDTRAILRNNDVVNNYFNSIGNEYYSSAAIGAAWPQDMDVVHNEIANVPYSGIHIGQGHNAFPKNVHKNTHIDYNYIHEVVTTLNDGGNIYVMGYTGGDASNMGRISNNYVVNQYHETGALYTDNYSNWWNVTNNVVINAARYFMSNWASNVYVRNTFTNVSAITTNSGGVSVSGTTMVTNGNLPPAAQTIVDNAGLEKAYQDIKPVANSASLQLDENFDSMNEESEPTGWTIDNAGGDGTVIVKPIPTITNKSMQLAKTGTTSGKDLVSSHEFMQQVSGTAEVSVRAEQTNADITPLILKAGATNAIEIAFRNTGKIAYKNASGSWVDIQAYTTGTWYKIKLEFDVVPDTFNLFIDGQQKLTNTAFAHPTDALNSIAHQIKSTAKGVVYIDDVKVYDGYVARTAVSTGKTITGFSSQYNTTGWSVYNINDGTVSALSAGWASVGGSGTRNEWVTIDLGQTYTLNSFTIQSVYEDNANVKDYVLYGSSTGAFAGEEFVLSSGTLPQLLNSAKYSATFTPAEARYIKFKGTSAYGGYVKVGELSLYGVSTSLDPLPVVTASSTYSGAFAPYNAVDSNINNSTGEWASKGEANPWIKLTWEKPKTINNIVLYDRANLTDNANGGTLTFSDGSSVTVTGIPTNGSAKLVQFPSKTITWVQFQVTGGSGPNVGLSEIRVNEHFNVASNATVTASSQFSASFIPSLATDGKIQSSGSEWVSSGQQNPWIQLNWTSSVTINKVVLFDRFATSDWAPGGTLTFSDGSTLDVSGIQNNGRGYTITFPDKAITWVKFQVSGGSGSNVGLTEIEVYGEDPNPVITASSQLSDANAASKANDGYMGNDLGEWASSGELNPWIKYTWSQYQTIDNIVLSDRINADNANGGTLTFSDGSSVSVTDIPTNGMPKLVQFPAKLVTWVQFQVSEGSGSNVGLSEMKVNDRPNVALNATATASSHNPTKLDTGGELQVPEGGGSNIGLSEVKVNDHPNVALISTDSSQYNKAYVPSKAIDGNVYPGSEWAAAGQKNPWIQLDWTTSQTISKITFYDRFNVGVWTPGGTLTFSDGSTLTVSGIQNDGQGYTITFPNKTVTWVRFQVAEGSGPNVGLTEIEVY